jgi:hypothetical protein
VGPISQFKPSDQEEARVLEKVCLIWVGIGHIWMSFFAGCQRERYIQHNTSMMNLATDGGHLKVLTSAGYCGKYVIRPSCKQTTDHHYSSSSSSSSSVMKTRRDHKLGRGVSPSCMMCSKLPLHYSTPSLSHHTTPSTFSGFPPLSVHYHA